MSGGTLPGGTLYTMTPANETKRNQDRTLRTAHAHFETDYNAYLSKTMMRLFHSSSEESACVTFAGKSQEKESLQAFLSDGTFMLSCRWFLHVTCTNDVMLVQVTLALALTCASTGYMKKQPSCKCK